MSDEEKKPEEAEKKAEQTAEEEALDQDIAEVTREIQVLQDKYLRAVADLENFRKRARKEQQDAVAFTTAAVFREILPVLDNLDRALEAARNSPSEEALLEGVELIRKQLCSVLEKHGVQPIEAVGKRFDPLWHEAVGQQPTREVEEGTILEETEKGYSVGERILRPAKVIVAVPAPPAEQ
jgi:molecular chaperone GrpE